MESNFASPHLSGYQDRDWEVIDYEMFELPGTGLRFRGPPPASLGSGEFFTCIGAAQTFGCFCERPYPSLLAAAIGMPSLNLGYGGAGPEFFANQETLHRIINRGKFLVVQVMSGRSQSNSVFDCGGLEYVTRRSDGKRLGATDAYRELLGGAGTRKMRRLGRLGRGIGLMTGLPRTRRIIAETRRLWVESNLRLFAKIEVPIVLFWFSKRGVDYPQGYRNIRALFGEFPQLVNGPMISQVKRRCDSFVECVSSRGSPQPLVSRHTGQPIAVDPALDRPDLGKGIPWTHNCYYPSPGMHEDAADALKEVCRRISDTSPKKTISIPSKTEIV